MSTVCSHEWRRSASQALTTADTGSERLLTQDADRAFPDARVLCKNERILLI
jgi:hypothetical protein